MHRWAERRAEGAARGLDGGEAFGDGADQLVHVEGFAEVADGAYLADLTAGFAVGGDEDDGRHLAVGIPIGVEVL